MNHNLAPVAQQPEIARQESMAFAIGHIATQIEREELVAAQEPKVGYVPLTLEQEVDTLNSWKKAA